MLKKTAAFFGAIIAIGAIQPDANLRYPFPRIMQFCDYRATKRASAGSRAGLAETIARLRIAAALVRVEWLEGKGGQRA